MLNLNYILNIKGEFVDGLFDGKGSSVFISGEEQFELYGKYNSGIYEPTVGETFNYIGQLNYFGRYYLPLDLINYIDEKVELYPFADKESLNGIQLKEFEYKHFIKMNKQDDIGLIKLNLNAIQVFENDLFSGKLTSVLSVDSKGNFYVCYYLDTIELYEGDTFTVYGIPCTTTSFENISGGITNAVVLAACNIEKK